MNDSHRTAKLDSNRFSWRAWVGLLLLVATCVLYFLLDLLIANSGYRPAPLRYELAPSLTLNLERVFLLFICWVINLRLTRMRVGFMRRVWVLLFVTALIGGVLSFTIGRIIRPPLPGTPHFPWPQALLPLLLGCGRGLTICSFWVFGFMQPLDAESRRLRSAAELEQIRSQLSPHFLLNTLNTIAGLVKEEPEQTRRLIVCLGDLLRESLHSSSEPQTLAEELAWLQRYAEILEARYGGALRFRWLVEPQASTALVPRFLLQPLVENAVKHGALRHDGEGSGEVTLRAFIAPSRAGQQLVCQIEDNGPGASAAAVRADAFGLRAVKTRLQIEYPGSAFQFESTAYGARVRLSLPYRTPPSTPERQLALERQTV